MVRMIHVTREQARDEESPSRGKSNIEPSLALNPQGTSRPEVADVSTRSHSEAIGIRKTEAKSRYHESAEEDEELATMEDDDDVMHTPHYPEVREASTSDTHKHHRHHDPTPPPPASTQLCHPV